MHHFKFGYPLASFWLYLSCVMWLFCVPAYGAEPIDGFRNLKFGMDPQEVQALTNCSTPHECIYELSNKNRYVTLTYGSDDLTQSSESTKNLRLVKITIDMGQYSEGWYNQLQMILGNSYRLTHDFTDETMNAFLSKQLEELQIGYEDGQVVLTVVRRQFGNMILKVIYQNTTLGSEFFRQRPTTPTTAS